MVPGTNIRYEHILYRLNTDLYVSWVRSNIAEKIIQKILQSTINVKDLTSSIIKLGVTCPNAEDPVTVPVAKPSILGGTLHC